MEFPRHHRHQGPDDDEYPPPPRHHHHQRPEDNEYPPPPQPYRNSPYDEPPPPTQVTRVHHSSPYDEEFGPGRGSNYPSQPPPVVDYAYDPPPPRPTGADFGYAPPPRPSGADYGYAPPPPNFGGNSSVEHVSHHSHFPHLPSFGHHHSEQASEISGKRPVRVYTKAEPNFSLTIRDGHVILARSDPSDPCQRWIKDESYSTKVKDKEGFPSFALVNQATGQAIKHSIGATHPVRLIPYKPDYLDESVLWTESRDLGDTYRTIRMVNNIQLNVDALNGDQNHGGVHDGTTIVLWEWKKGENQRWKIIPY